MNERARLDRLKSYGVLDTPPEAFFDRLTRLGARHFHMPIVMVNLVDETRQWSKAGYGLETAVVERRLSFCAFTILDDAVMVVRDVREDERFADHELVTGPPHLRFYAGAPLITPDGLRIGTFSLLDYQPHPEFGTEDERDLEDFARLAMHEMETMAARRDAQAAEARLRDKNALLESLLESVTDPIFAKDRGCHFTLVNSATAKLFGRTREEVAGLTGEDLFPPEEAERLDSLCGRVMATGREETVEEELPFPTEEGRRVLMIAVMPLRDARGAVIGVVGVARDITARKRVEDALRSSEARFRTLVDNTPLLMWLNRPDGNPEYYNAELRAYTGQDVETMDIWKAIHPDDRPGFVELRTRSIAAGTPYQCSVRLQRSDGAWRWHQFRVVPVREKGMVVSWIGTAVDIHEIRRAKEAAEEADRSKGRFLAAASHDLRQPMQSILLFAGALSPHVTGEAGRLALDRLQQGLDTLKDLLEGLLDVSRLDAGVVAPQIEEFPIADLLGPLSAAYAQLAEAKGLDWRVVPFTGAVRSDRVLLGRMLRNLIDNAIRYTDRGRVMVDCRPQGTRLYVEVHDTGLGIPPEQRERIFEEFHQIGNPERDRDRGVGLGLAIVRRLSRLLDHPVDLVSRPGGGSIFSISVPLVRREALRNPASGSPASRAEAATVTGEGRLAVVVEDDAIVMMGLAAMLGEWGFTVLSAGSAKEALERLRAKGRRPDIVLADYRLRQGRVGTEAILGVRNLFGTDVPGIIVTGEIGPEPQRDAARHGIGLLHKPVTPRLLGAVLARHLGAVGPA